MTGRLFTIFCIAAAPFALAQTADLRVVTLEATKASAQTGERLTVSMRWRNVGTAPAESVVATLDTGARAYVLTGAGTSNWPCEPTLGNDAFVCLGAALEPGAEAVMVVSMLAPASATPPELVLSATLSSSSAEANAADNTAVRTVSLTEAASRADLVIGPHSQTIQTVPDGDATIPIVIHNDGPDEARNVTASFAFEPGSRIPLTVTGDGWRCANLTHSPWLASCARSRLAAGVTTSLLVRIETPHDSRPYSFGARVAAEGQSNGDASRARATATMQVGTPSAPEHLVRLLVPLTSGDAPGENGSLWRTQTTALIRSATAIEILPDDCAACELPLMRPFDARAASLIGRGGNGNGQFLYLHPADAAKLQLTTRVWDASRAAETAGTEIPVVAEEKFTGGTLSLVGIPVAPAYRTLLRIYGDGFASTVEMNVFANDETSPRLSRVVSLAPPGDAPPAGDLPLYPAYAQIDPTLIDLDGVRTLRIDVRPLEAGRSIWAFASITNNDTHHVTTISAQ